MRWAELRRAFLPVAVAVIAAAVTTFAIARVPFLQNAERWVRDLEIAVLTPAQPQSPDIVIVTITEDTLKQFRYREPVDREFLAKLLRSIEAAKPRVIGLDVLFDQPTDPEKDAALKQVIDQIAVPLVVSYVAIPEDVDPQQKAFLDAFVPPGDRVMADIGTDPFDGTARWAIAGQEVDGTYIPGFARGVLEKIGMETSPEEVEIAWRGRESDAKEPFAQYPAQFIASSPKFAAKNLAGKIVLI